MIQRDSSVFNEANVIKQRVFTSFDGSREKIRQNQNGALLWQVLVGGRTIIYWFGSIALTFLNFSLDFCSI